LTVTLVFRTGDTDAGVIEVVPFTVDAIVRLSELETVRPLISIVVDNEEPALAVLSKAEVRHTRVVVVESYGTQVVS